MKTPPHTGGCQSCNARPHASELHLFGGKWLCEICEDEAQSAAEFDFVPDEKLVEVDGLVAASDRRIAIGFERMRS